MHVYVCQRDGACASVRVLVHPYTCTSASVKQILTQEIMDRMYARERETVRVMKVCMMK